MTRQYSVRTLDMPPDVLITNTTGTQVEDMGKPGDLGVVQHLREILAAGWEINDSWEVPGTTSGSIAARRRRVFFFTREV